MAPSIFASGTVSSVSLFEIRLDQNNLIFRGGGDEASSTLLRGSLVLCLSDSLRLQCLRMRFTGEKRIAWTQPGSSGMNYVKSEEEFFRHTWDFVIPSKRTGEILQKGNYEWAFEYVVPGNFSESVEGLADSWVIYRMKATLERGILQQNSVARKHVRLIRTLHPSSLELSHAMSVENTWPGKIGYSLSTPTKGVIFGTAVRVDFKLIPLLKGLTIGNIAVELTEIQELVIAGAKQPKRASKRARVVVKETWNLPDDVQTEEVDGQEGYFLQRYIMMPKSLRQCVQTVETMGIKIRHTLNFNIQLHNPDSHVSELHATLPLSIFISPNLPLDENNNVVYQELQPQSSDAVNHLAPPLYGEHLFDQLYSEVDLSGYMTPAGGVSGRGTPFLSQSRRASTDDLASMDAATPSDFAANALQSRLRSLENIAPSRWARDRPYNPGSTDESPETNACESIRDQESPQLLQNPVPTGDSNNPGGSPNLPIPNGSPSRGGSEEDPAPTGTHTPQHIELSANDLSKVPSYTTALHTRATAPINDGLPNYQTATSPFLPQPPGPIHVRGPLADHSSQGLHNDDTDDAERRRRILMAQSRH